MAIDIKGTGKEGQTICLDMQKFNYVESFFCNSVCNILAGISGAV